MDEPLLKCQCVYMTGTVLTEPSLLPEHLYFTQMLRRTHWNKTLKTCKQIAFSLLRAPSFYRKGTFSEHTYNYYLKE